MQVKSNRKKAILMFAPDFFGVRNLKCYQVSKLAKHHIATVYV